MRSHRYAYVRHAEASREELYGMFERSDIPKSEGVRTEDTKYLRYFEQDPVYEELYDLRTDPNESVNLATDPRHAARLAAMRRTCDRLCAQAGI